MPELRLVVLALQDRLAYGPTFESAMSALFGASTPTLASPVPSGANLNKRIVEAAKDLSDYQRLTAEGKLAEAGQKLEHLKHTLDELSSHPK